jgi:uncharacterized protein YlzI (FlbEa/FlbD family)
MIRVHRLNDKEFLVNCELIEFVEETPNTVISMYREESLWYRKQARRYKI